MSQTRVLFLCVHNSARSQMAEAFLKKYGGDSFQVESAGLEPGKLNPVVVEAMQELQFDISGNRAKGVMEFIEQNEIFDYVVTVCDESSAQRCPIFPGDVKRLHWGFEDPSGLAGNHEEKLAKTRIIRDQILARVKEWLNQLER